MLPSEFIAVYGRPVFRSALVPTGGTLILPSSDTRYLLVLWATDFGIEVFPDNGDTAAIRGFRWLSTVEPITFTHQLHGSMVGMSFKFKPLLDPCNISWVEGFMSAPTTKSVRASNATRGKVSHRASRDSGG